MHTARSSIEEVPYCFPRSSFKFQGQREQKIADFDPDLEFPDCNYSLDFFWQCANLHFVFAPLLAFGCSEYMVLLVDQMDIHSMFIMDIICDG